jgi:hypothetical protein
LNGNEYLIKLEDFSLVFLVVFSNLFLDYGLVDMENIEENSLSKNI